MMAPIPAGSGPPWTGRPSGAGEFDFLLGSWTVAHRKLRRRLAGSEDWIEFDGTLVVQPILGGLGNIDENVLQDPGGRYLATSLRLFDPRAGSWSIRWIDGRQDGIDVPVVGRFDGRLGSFYADDELEGRPIRIRFTYEDRPPGTAFWTQAFSPDGGRSWEVNWTMLFTRAPPWTLRP